MMNQYPGIAISLALVVNTIRFLRLATDNCFRFARSKQYKHAVYVCISALCRSQTLLGIYPASTE